MNVANLQKQFARMGAQLDVLSAPSGFSVDVRRQNRESRFTIALGPGSEANAGDVQPRQRHLLLVVRQHVGGTHKFLCGHDERDWFAAAVPDNGAANVRSAMEALQPLIVRRALVDKGVRRQNRNRRRNAAFIRQGEWFFIPSPRFRSDPALGLQDEPLSRGRGKPHIAEFVCRFGGEAVYVSSEYPQGLSEARYRKLLARQPYQKNVRWTKVRRNPVVYANGRVRHPDHKTIHLACWHQVVLNTETQAASMSHLAFLD